MEALEMLGGLALAHPRLAGGLAALGALLSVIGVVCAQIDPDRLREQGWPRVARLVELGAQIGALAVALGKARRKGGES